MGAYPRIRDSTSISFVIHVSLTSVSSSVCQNTRITVIPNDTKMETTLETVEPASGSDDMRLKPARKLATIF